MGSLKYFLVILFSIVLSACGGGGGSSSVAVTDTTAPTVSSTTPASAATGVALNSPITATFSEAMTSSTINSTTFTVAGVTGTVTYSGTTATFTPSANLAASTTYTATISTGVKDVAGNALGATKTWSFTTGTTTDTTAPTVSSTSPASGDTGVAANASITATFDEPMSNVSSANFTVAGVTGTVTYSGVTATFTPSANLAYSTSYTATISTAVTDLAGNPMAATKTWSFTTGAAPDTTAPTVSSTTPASSATGVAVNGAITATFSEAMSNVSSANFTVAGVTGTVTYSGVTATFTPSANLAYSTTYTATISTAVTDLAGNQMAATKTWTFTTGAVPDTTAPTVSSTNPASGATGVAVNGAITATFSEAMSNVTSANFTVAGVTGTVTYSGTTATFTPSANLAYSTTYTATISTAVTDLAGNSMAATKTWSFTTGAVPDTTAPTVSSTSPASGATGVAVNALITATFSEAMSNVSSANFTVAGVTGTVTYSGVTATFTPSANLAYSTSYTATISTAVTDLAGNPMAATKTWSFTTGALPVYAVSGKVTGPWVDGLTINMTGSATGTTTTDASGNYSFPSQPNGSYTFTPAALPGYTYTPVSITIANAVPTVSDIVAASVVTSYTISGTATYGGMKTGVTYIRVHDATCTTNCTNYAEISLPAEAGAYSVPYTIRGVWPTGSGSAPATYVVKAFIDVLGTGWPNASNPGHTTPAGFTLAANKTYNFTINDQAAVTPLAPTVDAVQPSDGAAFVIYTPVVDVKGRELADAYTIYWGTNAAASTGGGSVKFTAQGLDQTLYLLSGLTNGSTYFKMTAWAGATESAASAVTGPVTIGATSGASTLSGTVTFPGTATGPMMVGFYSDTLGVYYTTMANPVSPQSYSVAGLPNGSFFNFAVIDNDNSGTISFGDIHNTDGDAGSVTVSGSSSGNDITLSLTGATAIVNTEHQFDGTNNYYSLILGMSNGIKQVVGITVISGANIGVPYDIGRIRNGYDRWIWLGTTSPTVGDAYKYRVKFSDGTTQDISDSVNTVLSTNAMAQNLAYVTDGTGGSSAGIPYFTWTAPSSPLASYTYRLYMWGNSGFSWDYPQDNPLPSTTLNALYDGTALAAGTYYWQVQVIDANGDRATRQIPVTVP